MVVIVVVAVVVVVVAVAPVDDVDVVVSMFVSSFDSSFVLVLVAADALPCFFCFSCCVSSSCCFLWLVPERCTARR